MTIRHTPLRLLLFLKEIGPYIPGRFLTGLLPIYANGYTPLAWRCVDLLDKAGKT